MYFIVKWSSENTYDVIPCTSIIKPRKEFVDYHINEEVNVLWKKKPFSAVIVAKSGAF